MLKIHCNNLTILDSTRELRPMTRRGIVRAFVIRVSSPRTLGGTKGLLEWLGQGTIEPLTVI